MDSEMILNSELLIMDLIISEFVEPSNSRCDQVLDSERNNLNVYVTLQNYFHLGQLQVP